jgi:small subunit ribosomal protein S2
MEADGTFDRLPKKKSLKLNLEIEKLEKFLGGIKEMKRLPALCLLWIPEKKELLFQKQENSAYPLWRLWTQTCDPDEIDYLIPGNDDAIRAVKLISMTMANAYI